MLITKRIHVEDKTCKVAFVIIIESLQISSILPQMLFAPLAALVLCIGGF